MVLYWLIQHPEQVLLNLVVAANTAVENPLSVVTRKVDQHQDMQSFTEIQAPLSVVFKQQTPTYLSTPPQIIA